MLPWFDEGRFPLVLAPMAGFTDVVFRELCKREGADVLVSEFVMANRFLDPDGEVNAWETVDFTEAQRPMGVQLFGSDGAKMGEAARRIVDRLAPDFIDLNFGCPAPKVVDNCAGSSLLRDLPRLASVARGVVGAVGARVPVTAKIRIGWDDRSIVATEAARLLEGEGIRALTVHGRTKVQGYQGEARWDVIEAVAAAAGIPVVGNGGIESAKDVADRLPSTSVRGFMVGRAALGYPWIFREIKGYLETGAVPPEPLLEERWATILWYCDTLMRHTLRPGRWDRLQWMRARLKSFTKRMPGCRKLRPALDRVATYDDLRALAADYLEGRGADVSAFAESVERSRGALATHHAPRAGAAEPAPPPVPVSAAEGHGQ